MKGLAAILAGALTLTGVQSRPPEHPLLRLPAPAGATSHGGGGGPDELPSAHVSYRLVTTLPAATIAEHYSSKLTALGWTPAAKAVDERLVVHRFAVAAPEPAIGLLTVVPFPIGKQTVVIIGRLNHRWKLSGRAGGAGANSTMPLSFSFGMPPRPVHFPKSVGQIEPLGGFGGGVQMSQMRVGTTDSASAMLDHLERTWTGDGWTRDARLGDRTVQVIRRSSVPDPETDASEIWMLTAVAPGQLDLGLAVTRIWRGGK